MSWQAELAAKAQASRAEHISRPITWVMLDAPCERIWCHETRDAQRRPEHVMEDVPVMAALYGACKTWSNAPSGIDGVRLLVMEPPWEIIAVAEAFVGGFVACLQRNGIHGTTRVAGTNDERRF